MRPLLAALGWAGELRYLEEAIGANQRLEDIAGLRRALARLNYMTRPVKAALGELTAGDLPALLVREDADIWVVLSRQADGRLTVFKGAGATVQSICAEEGEGRLYLVAPGETAASAPGKPASSWAAAMLASEARTIRSLFTITFCVNLVALAVPIYLIAVFDRAVAAKSLSSLAYLCTGALLALVLENMLREMRARGLAYLGARMEGLLMTAAFERLLLLPAGLIENASIGAQLSRLKLFESLRDVFSGPLAAALLDLPFILIFVLAVFVIGGPLGWLIVAFIALLLLVIGLSIPVARRHVARAGEMKTESQRFLMEFSDNIDVIRQCGAEAVWIDRYRKLTEASLRHAAAAHKASIVEQTLTQNLVLITGGAIIGFGAYLVIQGSFTAGALMAMMALVWRVLGPIQTAFLHLNKINQAIGILQQVDQLMRVEPEYRPESVPSVPRSFKGPIELQGVVMRYSPRAEPALRGVSMQVPLNGFVALTGHVGSGKSTLLKVIAQLYLPQSGTVLLDGLDYRQFDARLLRHSIGFLTQRQDMFSGTIAQNIRLGRPDATEEEILAALKELDGEGVVDALESGIHTPIERGHPITGSEAFLQKLMLARAFLGNPAIYLLDEPSARLGARDDDILRAKLRALKGKATIVLATTRPSYMYLADRLVVLKAGQIIAQDAPNRVIAALLGEKFKNRGGAAPVTAAMKDIRDFLPSSSTTGQS